MARSKVETKHGLERSPSQLLRRALQRASDLYAERGGDEIVTQRQFAVLAAVQADEGLSQTALVRSTGIDRSTLADLVSRMLAKGLLQRSRSQSDGRANTVSLTDAGRAALEQAAPRAGAADEALLRLLSSSKRDGFLNALEAIAAGERPKRSAEEKARDKAAKAQKKAAKKAKKIAKKAQAEPIAA